MTRTALPSSFRDPSGFLFWRHGSLLRQVNPVYRPHYDRLMDSGLYAALTGRRWLIPHEEIDPAEVEAAEEDDGAGPRAEFTTEPAGAAAPGGAYRILRPEIVRFISHPYEWSFSQLKHAALLTLRVQRTALEFGMTLKDASAYNVQFHEGRPLLIDTLSFETQEEHRPWVGYRQFCQHFLAPLALMAYRDVRLGQLLRVHVDGIPLDLASRLLPLRTRLRPSLLMHLHAHAASQKRYAHDSATMKRARVGRRSLLGIIDSLRSAVRGLRWEPAKTEWAGYYDDTSYTARGLEHKAALVGRFLDRIRPASVWDLGSNDGRFSRMASERGALTVSVDGDPAAVELNYRHCRQRKETRLLPLLVDLTNPSPGLGWSHEERMSLLERGPAEAVLALALIHHLAISNNVPLPRLASFFRSAGHHLIIEWVPKSDSQVQRLLATREDVFPTYDQASFETAFGEHFEIEARETIQDSRRALYLMRTRPRRG